jgi:hypothetical protein
VRSRAWLALCGPLLFAACSAAPPEMLVIRAIQNDAEDEPVPCAVFVDGELAKDANQQMVTTPASIPVHFQPDPSQPDSSAPVQIVVYPLNPKTNPPSLPNPEAAEFPEYRVDAFARRTIRSNDARTLLFILQKNSLRKTYPLPRPIDVARPNE